MAQHTTLLTPIRVLPESDLRGMSGFRITLILFMVLSVAFLLFCFLLQLLPLSRWIMDWSFGASIAALTATGTLAIMAGWPHLFDIRTFRLPGILVVGYLGMIVLPMPWVYADFPNLARNNYVIVITLTLICTLLGILAGNMIFYLPAHRIRQWMAAPAFHIPSLGILVFSLLVFCLLLLTIYILKIGTLPVISAIMGGSSKFELAQAREDAFKLLDKSLRTPISYLRTMLFPFATLMSLVLAIQTRRPIWRALFVVSLLGNLILAGATLEKSPVMALVIMIFATWLITGGWTVSPRVAIVIAVMGLAFPIFVVSANYGFSVDAQRLSQLLFRRIFYAPTEVILAYVDYFSGTAGFLWGRTLPYISKLLPGGPVWIENIIGLRYFYTGIDSINANGGYPAYLWADFGWFGVIVGGFVVGLILQSIQVLVMRVPKSAPTIALQSLLIWRTFMLTSASFGGWLDWAIWETAFAFVLWTLGNIRLRSARASSEIRGAPLLVLHKLDQ